MADLVDIGSVGVRLPSSSANDSEHAYEVVCRADDPDWLERRSVGIGASEIAAALGEDPWRSEFSLYHRKIGNLLEEQDQAEHQRWGHLLEPVIITEFRERTGRFVDKGGLLLRSLEYPWALATLDAWICDKELGPYWPLDVKNASAFKAEEWVDGCPEHYRIQLHQQMIVTGRDRATVACLLGGNRLVWADVERDDTLVRKIVFHGERFWKRVLDRDEPAPDESDSSKRTLLTLYPKDNGSTIALPGELGEEAERLVDLKAEAKRLAQEIEAIENKVRAELGAAEKGVLPNGYSFTWKTQQRRAFTVQASTMRVLRMTQPK